MFSPETIRQMSDDASKEAARKGKKPFVFFNDEAVDRCPPWPFPFVGDHRAKGWTPYEEDGEPLELFVDTSGFGGEREPAMTTSQLQRRIKSIRADVEAANAASPKTPSLTVGFAITQVGQFQAYIGVFIKTNK